MLRAVALAARLGFTIDRDTLEAIRALRGEIVKSSPARLLDEIYKILRQGASRRDLRDAAPGRPARLPAARGRRRASREQAASGCSAASAGSTTTGTPASPAPDDLTNAAAAWARCSCRWACRCGARRRRPRRVADDPATRATEPLDVAGGDGGARRRRRGAGAASAGRAVARAAAVRAARRRPPAPDPGRAEPPARGAHARPRVKHLLAGRGYLEEALRWLEIHGGVQGQELAADWRGAASWRRADGRRAGRAGARGRRSGRGRRRRRRRRRRAPAGAARRSSAGSIAGLAAGPSDGRSHMALLTDDEIATRLAALPGWTREGERHPARVRVRRLRGRASRSRTAWPRSPRRGPPSRHPHRSTRR